MDAKADDNLQNLETNRCEVCQNPALHRCGGCRRVYYCSKQHQREHWRKHKNNCKVFKICASDRGESHLIATRTINSGELIIQEQPLIWGPSFNTVPVCLGCGGSLNEENSKPCNKCGWPVCGELCEKAPAHLPECRYTSQRGERVNIKQFCTPHPIYKCIIILRCLYHKQFLPKSWRKLEELETHWQDSKLTVTYEHEKATIAEFIRRFFKLLSVFSIDDIIKICGLVMINGHEVPITEPPSLAIYGTASMLEHNCSANCSISFTSRGQVVITAASRIEEGDRLSISYVNPLLGTPNRRHFLHEAKFFWCHCRRCEDPTEFGTNYSALKCQTINCDGYILPTSFTNIQRLPNWVCKRCSRSMLPSLVHDVIERIENDLRDLDKTSIDDCKHFLETYGNYLHENHFYCFDIKYAICRSLGQNGIEELTDEDLDMKYRMCKELEHLIKTIAPSEKTVLGVILFEKYNALLECSRRLETTKVTTNLNESRQVLIEVTELLKNEPEITQQGKLYRQALKKLKDFEQLPF